MIRTALTVVLIGLADSINPSTVGPAALLAVRHGRAREVVEFALGVFVVSLAGGLLILIGPGELVIGALPDLSDKLKHSLQLAGGVALVAAGIALWLARERLARPTLAKERPARRSPAIAGAAIMAIELPTAVPYFAAIAVIVGSGVGNATRIGMLVLFNAIFVLPLWAMVAVMLIAPGRSRQLLRRWSAWLGRNWPVVSAVVAVGVGAGLVVVGVHGLVS